MSDRLRCLRCLRCLFWPSPDGITRVSGYLFFGNVPARVCEEAETNPANTANTAECQNQGGRGRFRTQRGVQWPADGLSVCPERNRRDFNAVGRTSFPKIPVLPPNTRLFRGEKSRSPLKLRIFLSGQTLIRSTPPTLTRGTRLGPPSSYGYSIQGR